MWRLLSDLDYAALLLFVVKAGMVALMFAKGGSLIRLAVVGGLFAIILLLQAGLVRIDMVSHLWHTILHARAAVPQDAPSHRPPFRAPVALPPGDEEDTEVAATATAAGPASPTVSAAAPQNPVVKIVEMFSTFFLSMFPSDPPLPTAEAPRELRNM